MPALLIVALVTLGLMLSSVLAAWLSARARDDELADLRGDYDESSPAAVDFVSTRPPFDFENLKSRAAGDPEIANALITDFLAQLPALHQRVRVALDLGDARELAKAVSALRTLCAPFGAFTLLRSLDQLEKAAQTDITLAWRAADVFDRDLTRLTAALERARASA